MLKKILIGLAVVVVALGGVIFYVVQNLDGIVRDVIETEGTAAVGTQVSVSSVAIDLSAGSASIFGFEVANPDGFSDRAMLRFDELSVDLDIANTSSELIHITSIVSRNPAVFYETIDGSSNFDVVSARFASDETEAEPAASDPIQMAVDSVLVEGIQASMQSELLPRTVDVNLGTIRLQDMAGTPEQIAEQIMNPLIAQISRNAAGALVTAVRDIVGENAGQAAQALRAEAEDRLEDVEDQVNEQLDNVLGEDVREGLGNLLRGN